MPPQEDNIRPDPKAPGHDAPGRAEPAEPETAPARRPAWRRVVRWGLLALGGLAGVALLLVLVVLLALQTNWGAKRAGDALVALSNPFDDADLDVGTIRGNWLTHLELYDVTLTRADTVRMAQVDTLHLRYRLLSLLTGRIHVRDVYAAGVDATMQQQPDSTWDLLSFLGQDTTATDTTRSLLVFQVDHLRLRRGSLTARYYTPGRDSTLRIRRLDASLDSLVIDQSVALDLDALRAEVTPPGSTEPLDVAARGRLKGGRLALDVLRLDSPGTSLTASGTLQMPIDEHGEIHDVDFTLHAAPLSFRDLAPFVPALAPTGSATLDVRLQGTASLLDATAEALLSDGATLSFDATATPTTGDSVAYRVEGRVRGFDPAFITGDPTMQGRFNADVYADLRGPALDRLGGTARALLFDTRYGAYAFDRTTLQVAFNDGAARLELATGLRGTTLTAQGTVRPFDKTPTYDLRGHLRGFDLGRFADDPTQSSDIGGTFRLTGQGFDLRTADLTATLDLAASRLNQVRLEEGTLTARLRDSDLDVRSRLRFPEGLVVADGNATLGEEIRYQIRNGRFENLDVAALLGDTTRSALTGTFTLRGSGTDPATDLRLDALQVTLNDSFYDTYHIHTATVDGTLRGGRLAFTADADLDGGALDLAGTLRPFDVVPTLTLDRGAFEHLDIGRLTQNPDQHSDLTGSIGRLTLRGFDPQTMVLNARLDLAASRFNDQAIDAGTFTVQLQGGDLAFEAQLDTPTGTTHFAGTGRLGDDPVLTLTAGTLNSFNLGALLGIPGFDTALNGTVRELEVHGSDPQTMTLRADLELTESRINDATIFNGRAQVALDGGFARTGAELNMAQGSAQLTASGRFFDARPTYEAAGTLTGVDVARLAGIDTLQIGLTADFGVRGEGFDPATMTLQGRVDAPDARYDSIRVSALHTRFRLDAGLLNVDTLSVRSNVATLEASGPLALFDSLGTQASDFRFAADVHNTRPLRPLLGVQRITLGQGHVEGRLFGLPGTRQFDATATLNNLVYNEIRLSALDAHAAGTLNPDWSPGVGQVRAEMTYFSLPTLAVRYSEFALDLAGDSARYAASFTIDQRRDARLRGTVFLGDEDPHIALDDLLLHLDNERWELLQPATISYGDEYRISNFLIYSDAGNQQVAMDGVIDLDGNQSLILTIEALRTGAVADLLGFQGLGGTLNGTLDLTGPAFAPVLKGTLDMNVESFRNPVGTLRTTVSYDSLRLTLDALLTHVDGSTMALQGYLPIDLRLSETSDQRTRPITLTSQEADPRSTVALRLDADRFALGWALPFLDRDVFDKIEGQLTAHIDIVGTLENPELDGTATLVGGSLGMPEFGMTYTDIEAGATLQDNRVTLEHARGRAGDGRATAQGTIDLTQLTLGQFDIRLQADAFRGINSRAYRVDVSTNNLQLRGTTRAPILEGSVRLVSADFYLTDETSAADFEPVTLTDRDLQMLEEHFGIRVTEADTTTFDFYEALTITNLSVRMDRDVWLRSRKNPEMNIQFIGELDLQKSPNRDPRLFGSIDVIEQRSFINQFGKRFDIQNGQLIFNGPATDPQIDIRATYDVRTRSGQGTEITITLSIKGRLEDPTLELGSEPQTDMTNIVSYIATGRPADKAFQLGGLRDGAIGTGADLAISQLTNIVENTAGAELGLDVIEIRQEGLQGATITAGKYLSPQFYASVSWPISFNNAAQENTLNTSSGREFTLEYELFNWLLARVVSNGSTVRFNLLYEYSY